MVYGSNHNDIANAEDTTPNSDTDSSADDICHRTSNEGTDESTNGELPGLVVDVESMSKHHSPEQR